MTLDGRWAYSWDGENRLVEMETADGLENAVPKMKLNFAYDYQGRRVGKMVSVWSNDAWAAVQTNLFIYDGWNLIAEMINVSPSTGSGHTTTNVFVWGLDLSGSLQGAGGIGGLVMSVLGGQASNRTVFYVHDANGNVSDVVNGETGAICAHYEYSPFGETVIQAGDEQVLALNPYAFSTKYLDRETELYYYGHRFYIPETGRWLSRDPFCDFSFFTRYSSRRPWHEQGALEKRFFDSPAYRFAENDSINAYDPTGLYTVNKCTIVLFYGHGIISFFKGIKVDKCAGATAVTCQSQVIFQDLEGLIPGAVNSGGNDVRWGGIGPLPDGTVDANPLLKQNVAAMEAFAKVLCEKSCCCKEVILKQKCVGKWWECLLLFYGSSDLPKTIKCSK